MSGSSPSSSRRPRGRRRPASRGKTSQAPAPARHEAQDIPYVAEVFTPDPIPFTQLGLDPRLLAGIRDLGWTETRPVQSGVVPLALSGVDVIACAETGTGKTAAFLVPILQRFLTHPAEQPGTRVLVLAPTRELAVQIEDQVQGLTYHSQISSVAVYGGVPMDIQERALKAGVDIVVATPGRLMDHMRHDSVKFTGLEVLVLDEADRMLDMGFIKPVETIAAATPASRQTLLFSATLDGGIAQLGKRLLREPKLIEIAAQKARHEHIEQRLHYVDDGSHKSKLLDYFLRDVDLEQAIVFTATKRGADRLASKLYEEGHAAAALHGDMNQSQRNRTLAKLRSGNVRVLVATDVAARGIDVKSISHVINYDLPKAAEDYVHRIGRTGRAGVNGIAISFAAPDDGWNVRQIERYTGHAITAHVVEGLEPKMQPQRSSHKPGRPGRSGKPGGPGKKFKGGFGNRGNSAGRAGGNGAANGPRTGKPGGWNKDAAGATPARGKPAPTYASFRGR